MLTENIQDETTDIEREMDEPDERSKRGDDANLVARQVWMAGFGLSSSPDPCLLG